MLDKQSICYILALIAVIFLFVFSTSLFSLRESYSNEEAGKDFWYNAGNSCNTPLTKFNLDASECYKFAQGSGTKIGIKCKAKGNDKCGTTGDADAVPLNKIRTYPSDETSSDDESDNDDDDEEEAGKDFWYNAGNSCNTPLTKFNLDASECYKFAQGSGTKIGIKCKAKGNDKCGTTGDADAVPLNKIRTYPSEEEEDEGYIYDAAKHGGCTKININYTIGANDCSKFAKKNTNGQWIKCRAKFDSAGAFEQCSGSNDVNNYVDEDLIRNDKFDGTFLGGSGIERTADIYDAQLHGGCGQLTKAPLNIYPEFCDRFAKKNTNGQWFKCRTKTDADGSQVCGGSNSGINKVDASMIRHGEYAYGEFEATGAMVCTLGGEVVDCSEGCDAQEECPEFDCENRKRTNSGWLQKLAIRGR